MQPLISFLANWHEQLPSLVCQQMMQAKALKHKAPLTYLYNN